MNYETVFSRHIRRLVDLGGGLGLWAFGSCRGPLGTGKTWLARPSGNGALDPAPPLGEVLRCAFPGSSAHRSPGPSTQPPLT
jgi:hypothetical protein